MFLKAMFNNYKGHLLNLLLNYVTENRDKIDIETTENKESLVVNVCLNRALFTCISSYNEIMDTLTKIGTVKRG